MLSVVGMGAFFITVFTVNNENNDVYLWICTIQGGSGQVGMAVISLRGIHVVSKQPLEQSFNLA